MKPPHLILQELDPDFEEWKKKIAQKTYSKYNLDSSKIPFHTVLNIFF